MPCKCDNNACSTCVCAKKNVLCTTQCHGGKGWSAIPCLNTDEGKKVKAMSIKDIRTALCAHSLSPIGDKSELTKRLADFFRESKQNKSKTDDSDTSGKNKAIFDIVIENEGDHAFVLSLSGKIVSQNSSKADLRKAYLLLSTKVHPDKNSGIKEALQSFQIVLSAYEHLANPEKFDESEEEDAPVRKRQKTERFTRSNDGCYKTKIKCPQCQQTWGGADLGLEDAAYNFLMMGVKQYICGRCSCEFGCMTALHYCPHCNKLFEYDPDDYHRKITCGNSKCTKVFGFWMFKVSERREKEVRIEAKKHHEEQTKRIAQKNRRAARAGKRVGTDNQSNEQRLFEQLFIIGLKDECPRCGWELSRGEGPEEAKQHLVECNDQIKIERYQKSLEKKKQSDASKEIQQASQVEVMALKQWEQNGRQVGQLWMLTDNMLQKQCNQFDLDATGPKHALIGRLAKYLRSREKLMITDGKTNTQVSYDTSGISHVDEEDLPNNVNNLEREELRELCASYNISFTDKDVKTDLIRKFERARSKGKEVLMICDNVESEASEGDEEYCIGENDTVDDE